VAMPELTVVAEGDAPGGERWYLKAGGSAGDYYTLMETVHPDGRRDEGGMGGRYFTQADCSMSIRAALILTCSG
jgi:hypothetical protein